MMAYQPLQLPKGTPQLITEAIEPQLRAAHAMLRLPIETDPGLNASCHHEIIQVLLSVISGVSVVPDRLESRGDRGECFRRVLRLHFPWERDVDNAIIDDEAADILWDYFRGPLVHSLGFNLGALDKKVVVAKGPLKEADIEALEKSPTRPYGSATLTRGGQEIRLLAKALYWGVRKTVYSVAKEKVEMSDSGHPVGSIILPPRITPTTT